MAKAYESSSSGKMDEATLKNIVGQKITGSLGFMGGMLSKERLDAEQRYKGELYGDEQSGRSQVVARDVAESVDSMLPALLKVFTSGDEMVRFDPRKPKDQEIAKQATEYINWIWSVKNSGFILLHDWMKDALLKKLGIIKIYWDDYTPRVRETYKGLSDPEFQMLESDEDVEIDEHTERRVLAANPRMEIPEDANIHPGIPTITLHDVVAYETKKANGVCVVPVAPEEFLIDHRAVTLEESPFLCHRTKKTITELLEMGFDEDLVKDLGPDGVTDFNMERIERFKDEDAYPYRDDNYVDPSMREVWLNECYMKIDYDGDGIAELRQIILAGESVYTLLSNDEVDDHPFATLTPIPMPHKVYGMSIADQTLDLQRINTALWRGALDSIYFNITPQMGMVEGQVNLDDLLDRRPGGVVRMKKGDALFPIPSDPVSGEAFQMIEFLQGVKEARTGVRRFTSTLDSDQINPLSKTATQAVIADNAANDRLALIARIFGETGIKRAFRRVLELVCKHQRHSDVIRLRGQFVEFDPREWSTEMDVSISVGLGTGNQDQELQSLMGLAQLNAQIVQLQQGLNGPLLTAENVYNFLLRLCAAGRVKFAETLYTDPKTVPPQQPKPDPKMVEAQGKLQIMQQQGQMKAQQQQQQTQADIAEQQMRAKTDIQLDTIKAQLQTQLDKQQAALDMQLEQVKAQHEMQLERLRLQHETRMNEHVTAAEVQRTKAETQPAPKAEPVPSQPKHTKITIKRGKDGRAAGYTRHYEDGTSDNVEIARA